MNLSVLQFSFPYKRYYILWLKSIFFKETKRPYEDTHFTVFNRQNLIYLLFKGMLYRHSPIKVSSCIDENYTLSVKASVYCINKHKNVHSSITTACD